MTYHRLPSIRNGLRRARAWWASPGGHHTVLGRCACSLCELAQHEDKHRGRR